MPGKNDKKTHRVDTGGDGGLSPAVPSGSWSEWEAGDGQMEGFLGVEAEGHTGWNIFPR